MRKIVAGSKDDRREENMSAPRYDVAQGDHGLSAAAIREMSDGKQFVRVTEYCLPFVCLVPRSGDEGHIFISVPIDDYNHILIFGQWSWSRKVEAEQGGLIGNGDYEQDGYANFRGDRGNNWGQDRAAMAAGHFTGFTRNLLEEDVVVQVSMGSIADRTREFLVESDIAIVRVRQLLLRALGDQKSGNVPRGSVWSGLKALPAPRDGILGPSEHWADLPILLAAE